MKEIFYTVPEAAQFLFPDRPGSGGEEALRRMVKAKEINVIWSVDNPSYQEQ
jgi:hypothetical protein